MEGSALVVQVGNKTAYAPYVQGLSSQEPRQVRWAQPHGWQSIEDVGKSEWDKHLPRVRTALEGK